MKQKFIILTIFLLVVLLGCDTTENGVVDDADIIESDEASQVECQTNDDCAKAGCSSQLCTTKEKSSNTVTTCEFRPEYGCYNQALCGCVNGQCSFVEDVILAECLATSYVN